MAGKTEIAMNTKINELKIGETFLSFFLIRKVECKVTAGGKKYLDILMGDSTGEIVSRLWDATPEDESKLICHILVKVKGSIVEWQGKRQVKIDKIRPAIEKDGVNIGDYVPVAPYDPTEMQEAIFNYALKIENTKIKEMVKLILTETGEKLLTHPAAVTNHHAVRSGLLYHTISMLKAGERLLEVYSFLDKDLLFAGIILHDIAKIDEIEANELGIGSEYTVEGQLLGHIIQGVKKIGDAASRVGLDKETSVLLEHMILSHHYEPEFGSPKRPMIPEAELLHYLDILDARMFDMQKALGEVSGGEFTDKIWTLNSRRLYRPKEKE